MTITTLINAASVGTTAAPISNITVLSLNAATATVAIQALCTGGRTRDNSRVRVWFCTLTDNLAATAANVRLIHGLATYIDILPGQQPVYEQSNAEVNMGGYLYVWVEEPKLDTAATLTVKSIEL